jgi:2-oxoisovalerate dehydrogenase E1 component alpha subunit
MSIGQLVRHRTLGLSDEEAVGMYRNMLRARKFDERGFVLQRAGKIPFHVSGIGQEAAQVAAATALDTKQDHFLPYYRDYAFVLTVGMTMRELMLSLFAKGEDPNSGGRQMPGHFSHKKLNIVTGSSPVTTQVPHAVGIALAKKMRNEPGIAYVTFGEGSSNQGDFHEGSNFAGVNKLPVIMMCQNNQYAISIPASKQLGGRVVDRAIGYGFEGIRVDGNDPLEVYRVVKEARDKALNGGGPTLIEAMMYRISPHSTADDDMLYRTKEEVEENRAKDGIPLYRQYLMECGIWSEEQDQALSAEIMKEITEATNYADSAVYATPESTMLHVYADSEGGA